MNNVILQIEKIPENFNEARYLPVLNREELFRYKNFKDVARKRQFLFSRFILKNKLYEITGQNADEIHFELGPHGKPFISGSHISGRVHFNISHSENYVAYAISKKEIGIDIQAKREFSNLEGLIQKVCHSNEKEFLKNSSNKESGFLKIWNLKESYTKCLGLGLQTPFPELDFSKIALKNFDGNDSSPLTINGKEFEVSFKILDRTQKLFVSIFKSLEFSLSLPEV